MPRRIWFHLVMFAILAGSVFGASHYVKTLAYQSSCTITPGSLPDGSVGVAYSQTFGTKGGCGNAFIFSISAGNLPDGLGLDPNAGVLSGTPTTPGSFTFTVTVCGGIVIGRPSSQSCQFNASQNYTLFIAPIITPTFTPTSTPPPTSSVTPPATSSVTPPATSSVTPPATSSATAAPHLPAVMQPAGVGHVTIIVPSPPLYDAPGGHPIHDAAGNLISVFQGQTFIMVAPPVKDSVGQLWVSIFVGSGNYPYVPIVSTNLAGAAADTVSSGGTLALPLSINWPNPNAPASVELRAAHGILRVNANAARGAAYNTDGIEARMAEQAAQQTAGVTVTGNGTNDVTVSGSGSAVNAVLQTTAYQPDAGFVGVDQVVIAANSPSTAFSSTTVVQVVVVANSGSGSTGSGGSAGGNAATSTTPTPATTVIANGPATAYVLPNTVTNGNVVLHVLVQNGTFVESSNEIGNSQLLSYGVIQAVDVFGIGSSGNALPFNAKVKVCLQGTGRLFYLDAATTPRTASQLSPSVENGASCVTIANPGTLVLTH